jgi:hypothetical protein
MSKPRSGERSVTTQTPWSSVPLGRAHRPWFERYEDWRPSSYRHHQTGEEDAVEIESHWTASKREKLGIHPTLRRRA